MPPETLCCAILLAVLATTGLVSSRLAGVHSAEGLVYLGQVFCDDLLGQGILRPAQIFYTVRMPCVSLGDAKEQILSAMLPRQRFDFGWPPYVGFFGDILYVRARVDRLKGMRLRARPRST